MSANNSSTSQREQVSSSFVLFFQSSLIDFSLGQRSAVKVKGSILGEEPFRVEIVCSPFVIVGSL